MRDLFQNHKKNCEQ